MAAGYPPWMVSPDAAGRVSGCSVAGPMRMRRWRRATRAAAIRLAGGPHPQPRHPPCPVRVCRRRVEVRSGGGGRRFAPTRRPPAWVGLRGAEQAARCEPSSTAARAGNRRFWLLSALRAHAKAPQTDLHRKTLRPLKRPRRARTVPRMSTSPALPAPACDCTVCGHLRAVLTSAAESPLGLIIVWRLYGECNETSPPLGGWGGGKERTEWPGAGAGCSPHRRWTWLAAAHRRLEPIVRRSMLMPARSRHTCGEIGHRRHDHSRHWRHGRPT